MAITTLPYPSMDFVPLDILTATELDQLVANIEAINASSISTTAIANNAVTTAKIADGNVTTAKLGSDITAIKRTELYSGSTNSSASLSSAVSNFDEIEIVFQDTNSTPNVSSVTVPSSAGSVILDIAHAGGSSTVYWNVTRWTISGTTIAIASNHYEKAIASTSVSTTSKTNIYITQVVGIKYTN